MNANLKPDYREYIHSWSSRVSLPFQPACIDFFPIRLIVFLLEATTPVAEAVSAVAASVLHCKQLFQLGLVDPGARLLLMSGDQRAARAWLGSEYVSRHPAAGCLIRDECPRSGKKLEL